MSRVAEAFAKARAEERAALLVYLCAGDPDLATTPRLIAAAAAAGADVIELGVPFSDPTADGVAIQRASERSLRRGTTVGGVLQAVRAARRETAVPIVLFGYYNPFLAYGEERIVAHAADAGADGFLVVDLPPEEATAMRAECAARGLDFVPLVAPTSDETRVRNAAAAATAFLYYVSLTGVTGSSAVELSFAAKRAARLRAEVGKPVAVGFGVKTPEDVAVVAASADGVVVGSAVVAAIEQAPDPDAAVDAVRALCGRLRAAAIRRA
jgi:tryptophan synthase alpha chain